MARTQLTSTSWANRAGRSRFWVSARSQQVGSIPAVENATRAPRPLRPSAPITRALNSGSPSAGLERPVQLLLRRGCQRCDQSAPVLEDGQGRAQVARPEAERGEAAAVVVHQVFEVEQCSAAGREPAQQVARIGLALVGVPEEDMTVGQLARLVREFLQAEDHRVLRRRHPRARRSHAGADRLVVLDREDPLRGLLDREGHPVLDETAGVGGDDRGAAFGRAGLVAEHQLELGHTRLTSGRGASAANRPALRGLTSTKGTWPRYRSRTTSPTAGPWRKPWPEKPVA